MKPLRCILGLHDDTMTEDPTQTFPFYHRQCLRCGIRWEGIAKGRWRRVR